MKSLFNILVFSFLSVSAMAAPSFNAGREFSHTENPNGVWSYGFERDSVFHLFTRNTEVAPGVFFWQGGADFFGEPTAGKNEGPEPFVINGTTVYKPGGFALHPGPNGERAILRWTAPSGGFYLVNATFEGADPMTTTDVQVESGGGTLLFGSVTGNVIPLVYSGLVFVKKGDEINFSVGWGEGTYEFDTTLTRVIISKTNPGQARR